MRTFQFSDAKSHKFWNIDVQGNSFTVTYGKIGTSGQTQTKSFASPEKAQAEADKLVAEKTKKGYAETTPKATISDAEALEKALIANPDDDTAWRAFADFLAEQDDPRGEFMQVQIALEDESVPAAERKKLQTREKALLKKHEQDWLGPLAAVTLDAEKVPYWNGRKQSTRAPVGHSFRRGWLSRVEFHDLRVDQARVLAKSPGAKFLRELIVGQVDSEAPVGSENEYIRSHYEPGPDVPADVGSHDGPGLHALCRCPYLGAVSVFKLGEGGTGIGGKDDEYPNCHTSGELAHHVVKQMPNVEELYLLAHRVDANKLFVLPMPKLRVLQLYHSNRYPLDKLAANKTLTNLTTILCHPHALDDGGDDEEGGGGAYIRFTHLKAICRSPQLSKLIHLRLRLTDFGDKGADEIIASGILKRLKTLDLQGGCITDKGAQKLAACADLKNLEHLNLRSNALTDTGVKALKATGVKLDVANQHNQQPGEFGDGGMPEYLFEGDIE
jgi:uncharacterized protein (TIGR02996 family)